MHEQGTKYGFNNRKARIVNSCQRETLSLIYNTIY